LGAALNLGLAGESQGLGLGGVELPKRYCRGGVGRTVRKGLVSCVKRHKNKEIKKQKTLVKAFTIFT